VTAYRGQGKQIDMRVSGWGLWCLAALAAVIFGGAPAMAQRCNHTQSFDAWLDDFKREAAGQGISRQTMAAVLGGVSYDEAIVRRDRAQGVFSQTFLQFSGRMVAPYRLQGGAERIAKNKALFTRIESDYGVPAPVLVAFWGLETDFGANIGKDPILRALATLAYDCRRPELFRDQLMAALKIVQRGDLDPQEMIGAWAGELGQTQFLPAHYFEYGVDYDRDGKVDLRRSTPDVLASTANLLKAHGWQRGQPWLQEVLVPPEMRWEQADLTIQHPRSQWVRWGVKAAGDRSLPADATPASLLLPMGRNGPAFLAYQNFSIYTQWNQSLVYSVTAAYFATRLAGAPPYNKGRAEVPSYGLQEVKDLQQLLNRRGHDAGEADGKLGVQTRQSIRKAQIEFGLPADSYPSDELFARLRGR
jgi:lytic murein transglycosylase